MEVLRESCKKNGGYTQPHLNDQLFLQCRGFTKIQNLEPYTNVKVLWLEQNGIMEIEGLAGLERLVSLFLHNNTIRRIAGLDGLRNLRILNLSHNFITKLENLADAVPLLETLQISHNQLASLADCAELHRMEFLSSVDLSFNKIERDAAAEAETALVDFFRPMTQVTVLYLHGNAITHGVRNYRKNMVAAMKQLTYLDERPVFPDERATTDAWAVGGAEAEQAARDAIRKEKLAHLNSCVDVMQKLAAEKKDLKEQREREWEAQRTARDEAERTERARRRALVNDLENAEDDARGALIVEELDAWQRLDEELADRYAAALVEEAKAAEQRRVRAEVDAELQKEEEAMVRRIAAATAASSAAAPNAAPRALSPSKSAAIEAAAASAAEAPPKSAASREMEFWVRQLEQSDEEVVAQMQRDLEGFLRDLQPGPAPAAAAAAADSAPSKLALKAVRHEDPNRQTSVSAPPATTSAKKGGKTSNKFDVWEKYYAFEKSRSKATA